MYGLQSRQGEALACHAAVCFGWFVPADFYGVPRSVLLFLGTAEEFSCSNWIWNSTYESRHRAYKSGFPYYTGFFLIRQAFTNCFAKLLMSAGSVEMFHLVLSARRVIIAGGLTSNRVDLERCFEGIVYFTLSLLVFHVYHTCK